MEIYTSPTHPKVNTQMQVYSLKGHERPITTVKYNAEGDLLFSASKDQVPNVWYSSNGERLGTYGFHKGAVWDLDPSWDSKYLLTGGGDGYARLFEVTTGKYLIKMPHRGAVRAVSWSEGNHVYATASDPFGSSNPSLISIFDFPSDNDLNEGSTSAGDAPPYAPKFDIKLDATDKVICMGWSYGNESIIAGFDTGLINIFDPETASKDSTAKILDPRSLDIIKSYKSDRPLNGAVISPTHPHVIIGGGQDAQSVTTTSASQGKFESIFHHMVYGDEFGKVKGHFGPINALAIHPFGESYASGSEDGYVRLHIFDKSYLNMPDYLPNDFRI
eukprot:gene17558-23122_t